MCVEAINIYLFYLFNLIRVPTSEATTLVKLSLCGGTTRVFFYPLFRALIIFLIIDISLPVLIIRTLIYADLYHLFSGGKYVKGGGGADQTPVEV